MPMAMSTPASPMLNATMSSSPKPIWCSATALSNTTRAEGHGTIPPDTPRASRLRQVIWLAGRRQMAVSVIVPMLVFVMGMRLAVGVFVVVVVVVLVFVVMGMFMAVTVLVGVFMVMMVPAATEQAEQPHLRDHQPGGRRQPRIKRFGQQVTRGKEGDQTQRENPRRVRDRDDQPEDERMAQRAARSHQVRRHERFAVSGRQRVQAAQTRRRQQKQQSPGRAEAFRRHQGGKRVGLASPGRSWLPPRPAPRQG